MALEAIKQVTEMEAEAKARKAEAAANAKKLVSDAEKAGVEALEKARREAEEHNRTLLRQAEECGEAHTVRVMEEAKRSCQALRQAAQGRMEEAAGRIVGRVVNG